MTNPEIMLKLCKWYLTDRDFEMNELQLAKLYESLIHYLPAFGGSGEEWALAGPKFEDLHVSLWFHMYKKCVKEKTELLEIRLGLGGRKQKTWL